MRWVAFGNSWINRAVSQVSQSYTVLSSLAQLSLQSLKAYMLQQCPKEYHGNIIPKHRECFIYLCDHSTYSLLAPGCKRIIIDSDYLSSLSRPNLTLNFDGLAEITETGVLTKNGEIHAPLSHYLLFTQSDIGDSLPFDVIIFATGFTGVSIPFRTFEYHSIL